jgi:hypothetical protein
MRKFSFTVGLILPIFSGAALCQVTTASLSVDIPAPVAVKVENGLVLQWAAGTRTRGGRVDVLDTQGVRMVALDVLTGFPEASGISIWDVSARPHQRIAVAAVFLGGLGNGNVSTLLYYDWNGHLARALALDPSREVRELELDGYGNVWTLGSGRGDKDAGSTPLITVFGPDGSINAEFLKRSDFPVHADVTREGPDMVGVVSFGITPGVGAWLWLPGAEQLITIPDLGGKPKVQFTGVPRPMNVERFQARRAVVLKSSKLVMDTGWMQNSKYMTAINSWTPDGGWKREDSPEPELNSAYLLGADGDSLVFGLDGPAASVMRTVRKLSVNYDQPK